MHKPELQYTLTRRAPAILGVAPFNVFCSVVSGHGTTQVFPTDCIQQLKMLPEVTYPGTSNPRSLTAE